MYSKVVARQLEEAKEIALAVGKNVDQVAVSLRERLIPVSAEAQPTDWKSALDDLGRNLLETTNRLVEQDAEYQSQLLLTKRGRERRDNAMEKIRNQLRGARFLLDQAFGREKASSYFPERSEVGRVLPRNLLALARSIAEVLRGAKVDWPAIVENEPHLPKAQELAIALDAAAGELEAVLDALTPEKGGARFSRGTKRAELAATRKAVSSTTAALAGLFRVAGFDYAARTLRPPVRSRSKPEAEGTPPSPAPPPPATPPKAAVLPPAA